MLSISPARRFLSLLNVVLDTCPIRLEGKKQLSREEIIL